MTLRELFKGQDFNVDRMCDEVLNDVKVDPITQVIVDAWQNNGDDEGKFDKNGYEMDLQYAINQLTIAIKAAK